MKNIWKAFIRSMERAAEARTIHVLRQMGMHEEANNLIHHRSKYKTS